MKRLVIAVIVITVSLATAWCGESAHPGLYVGTLSFTNTDAETQKLVKQKSLIRLELGEETTMTVGIDGLFETQLYLNCKQYHGIATGYATHLGEVIYITLPMHFDKTGAKMTGALTFTSRTSGGIRLIEGKFKASKVVDK